MGRSTPADESGSGLLGSITGVTVFLSLIFLAVHLLLNLYATSTVTAVGFDAARIVAGKGGGPAAEASAEQHARQILNRYEDEGNLDFIWSYPNTEGDAKPDRVQLRVIAEHPTNLFANVSMPYQRIDRTFFVRMERVQ